jgi:hypothetical protein
MTQHSVIRKFLGQGIVGLMTMTAAAGAEALAVRLDAPLVTAVYSNIVVTAQAHGPVVSASLFDNGALVTHPVVLAYEDVILLEALWFVQTPGLHRLSMVVTDAIGLSATSTVPVLVAEAIRTPVASGAATNGITIKQGAVITALGTNVVTANGRAAGFVEFAVPKEATNYNALLRFSSEGDFVHRLFAYPANSFLNSEDLFEPDEFVGEFNDARGGAGDFEIDVTPWAQKNAGRFVGFKLKVDPIEAARLAIREIAQTFTSFKLVFISPTNDVPPRVRWLNAPENLAAFDDEPLVMRLEVIDPDSRVTKLQLVEGGQEILAERRVALTPGTNLISITWTNPTAQSSGLTLRVEDDWGARGEERLLDVHVLEGRRNDPQHRWLAKADRSDSFFVVDGEGRAWAWGRNNYGQLGLGIPNEVLATPRLLAPPVGRRWRQFAAGVNHSAALTDRGELYTMGVNWDGTLGVLSGTHGVSTEPVPQTTVPIPVPFPPGVHFWREVEACDAFTWMVDQSRRLWRTDRPGVLIQIPSDARVFRMDTAQSFVNMLVEREDGELVELPGDETPVLRPLGVKRWLDFSGSVGHTVAIGDDHQLYAWTANLPLDPSRFRNFAIPVDPVFTTPRLATVQGVTGWKRVVAHQMATIAEDLQGRLFGWGFDGYLGAAMVTSAQPVRVQIPTKETGWLDIGVGSTFAVAISDQGNVYQWGFIPETLTSWRPVQLPERVTIPGVLGTKLRGAFVANGNITLDVLDLAGTNVMLEMSKDLKTWTAITNLPAAAGGMQFSQPVNASGNLFIRAR